MPMEGGGWAGHVLPGTLFLIWSIFSFQGIVRALAASKREGRAYHATPWHTLPYAGLPLEPLVKVLGSGLGIAAELYIGRGEYQALVCPSGTARAGHFNGDNLNNHQHAIMYLCFITSGVIDLIAYYGCMVPGGAEHAFLSLAFLMESLLMGLHKKHTPLDQSLHAYLTYAMLASSALAAFEGWKPHCYIASCGRAAAVMLQGCWFLAIARIMFEHRPAWDTQGDTDGAPVQFATILFLNIVVAITAGMLLVHVAAMPWIGCSRQQQHDVEL